MIQISYVSRSKKPMSAEDLLNLLYKCRSKNERRGVSGMLLYGNGTFLQTIEGDEDVIDNLLDTISKDERHTEIQVLTRKEIPARQYSEWSMGFEEISDDTLKDVEGLRDFGAVDFTVEKLSGNARVVNKLLQHYHDPHLDEVLSELDAKDRVIRHLEDSLSTMRDRAALARLALESITEASRKGQPQESLIRLCESAVEALRKR